MKHERHDHGHGELAEIWRDAHHRRTQDARGWITRFFKEQRSFKLRLTEAAVRLAQLLPPPKHGSLASGKPECREAKVGDLPLAVFGLSGIAAGFFAGLFGIGGGLNPVPGLVYGFPTAGGGTQAGGAGG